MQATGTSLLPASRRLSRRLIIPRKTTIDGKADNSTAMTTNIPLRRDNNCHSGCDLLKRHESADEEVRIAKEAKRVLIGMATILAALAITAVVTKVYFARL
jgi:hypothetical protein